VALRTSDITVHVTQRVKQRHDICKTVNLTNLMYLIMKEFRNECAAVHINFTYTHTHTHTVYFGKNVHSTIVLLHSRFRSINPHFTLN
jgi:hypothetical protein